MHKESISSSGTERALLASQQRYERIANTLPVMLYDSVLAPNGTSRFLYVAPGPCREILELDPDALLKDMSLVWDIVHPDDVARFHQQDVTANQTGQEFLSEVRIITPSGHLKWLLVNSKPNPAEPDEPVVWSGYLQDITSRKQAEERLRQAEQKVRLMVDNSTNLFYMHTADHVLTYVSPQSRQFFDCDPEEALVRWTDFLTDNPVNRDGLLTTQRAIDTGQRQPPYQVECVGKKGRKLWVEVHEAPILENGRTVAISGTLTDITRRKQAQSERQQFFKFFQTSTDLMCIANPHGRFLKTNPAFTATLGYTAAELISKDIMEFVHPEDRQATLDEIVKQQQRGFTDNFENRY
ncbi:MAG TPA: PAS domain S-box protein, partial [Desulfuromonadales bacterium]|nr:PAS domain S-box protein [Desulfuromonadales bacterium]